MSTGVPALESHEARDLVQIVDLPPEEWERVRHIEPFNTYGLPNPELCKVVAAITPSGEVVATWWVTIAWHVEPLWIAPEHRKRPIMRRLWEKVHGILVEQGADVAFGIITDPIVVGQAAGLGFERAPGDLYFLRVKKEAWDA